MKKRTIVLTIFLLAACLMLTACDGATGGLIQELFSELEENTDINSEELSQLLETIPEDFTIPEEVTEMISEELTLTDTTEPETTEPATTEPETESVPDQVLAFESNGDGTCTVVGMGTCKGKDIVIPSVSPDGDRVTSIGDIAFGGRSGLTSIVIPDSVTSIGSWAFYYCESLTSIVIPDSVTSIGYAAFQYCSSLTSIVIPDSVTSIGNQAFWDCDSLTDVYYTGTEQEWAAITIGASNYDLTTATIHFNYQP